MSSAIYEMHLKTDKVLKRILPKGNRPANVADLKSRISPAIREIFDNLDGVITVLSVEKDDVRLTWKREGAGDPLDGIVKLLERRKYNEAVLLLELFKSALPDHPDYLYNLGMAYSDMSELDLALENLRRVVTLEPDHINGRVALGVALLRQGKDREAAPELRKAVEGDPTNPWAQRNLGACLMRLGEYKEALPYLKKSTELNPKDERAWFGLAQAYELTGNLDDADVAYRKVLDIDEYGEVAEQAKQARSKIAQKNFRSIMPNMERMDAVMYCLGALEKFEGMSTEQVRQIGFEVAILGMNGIDVNDPTPQYRLKTLSGTFSGLHLLCLQYVSFKQFAPEQNIGFDLAAEYRSAKSLYEQKKNSGK